jgi:hypothetical protein
MASTEIKRAGNFEDVAIANGTTTSDAIRTAGFAIFGLVMPTAFTGASISFTVSHDGTTYQALYDTTNTLVSLTVSASRSYDLPTALAAWSYFKIVSASSEGAARTLYVVKKG